MVGYEMLTPNGTHLVITSGLLTMSAFLLRFLYAQFMGCGMGNAWGSSWEDDIVPVLKWVRTASGGWVEQITHEKRGLYQDDMRFIWKWIPGESKMGWYMETPPPEVTVFMSDGIREAVSEIIKNTSKDTYN